MKYIQVMDKGSHHLQVSISSEHLVDPQAQPAQNQLLVFSPISEN